MFAHQQTGGTFVKHPSGPVFKAWVLGKFEIVNEAVKLLSKGAFVAVFLVVISLLLGSCLILFRV